MAYRSFILSALLSGAFISGAAANAWTLEQALQAARETNPSAAVAAERILQAQALADEADSSRLPLLRLDSSYTQTNQPMMAFGTILNTGTFRPDLDFNNPGTADNFRASATIAYPLYRGGSLRASREAARAGVAASNSAFRASLSDLDLSVVQAFYNVRLIREQISALEAALRALESSRENARARFERGQLLRNEVLDIEVRISEMRVNLLSAQHQSTLADKQFLRLVGRPLSDRVEIDCESGGLPPVEANTLTAADRPEIPTLQAQIEAAEAMVKAARGGLRPSVDAFANIQYDRGWRFNGDGESWMAGVQVQWDIFDGGRTRAQIRRSRSEVAEAKAHLQNLETGLQLQLESSLLGAELAQNQLNLTVQLVEQASESASISRARFEAGDLLATELLASETRLVEAQMRQAMARAQLQISLAELRHAAGLPLLPSL